MIKKFMIHGKPVGKARPRVTRNGTFTPTKTKNYQQEVKLAYIDKYSPYLGEEPVKMFLEIETKPAETLSKKKKEELYGKPDLRKPDIDNICKSVADGLNGIAYKDDNQVYKLDAKKIYSRDNKITVILEYMGGK